MIILIILYFFYLQGEWVVFFFFFEIQKQKIRWMDQCRIEDGPKCKHPFTWGCCVLLICDMCVTCQLVFKVLIVSYGCCVGRRVVLMLFVIYAPHLLVCN